MPPIAGYETLVVKLRSSVRREVKIEEYGQNWREIQEGGKSFHLFIRQSLIISFISYLFKKSVDPLFVTHPRSLTSLNKEGSEGKHPCLSEIKQGNHA